MRRNRRLSNRLGVIVESRLTIISISSFLQIKKPNAWLISIWLCMQKAFSLSSVGQYLGFAGSNPFVGSMDLFQKDLFLAFRGFESLRRRDGSVLEGTICKQFVSNAKNRKNLKPCRGFKSFRSLVFRIRFMKKCVFGSSNPSTRRKIENGSMEIRKKLGTKKAEKSLEISAFLVFSRSDLNRPKDLAGAEGIEPSARGFGDRCSTC